MSDIRKKTIKGLKTGDNFLIRRTFTEKETLLFGEITRDYNPVHYDKQFAKTKNLNDRICHGLLVGSMVTEIGGQIGWLGSELAFNFKNPVYFGDTITCTLTITDIKNLKAEADIICRNQDNTVVLKATLKGILPNSEEMNILRRLSDESY